MMTALVRRADWRREKARRVVRILERHLGIPRQAGRLPKPLDMLIATVLSQNTNDKNSHRAYIRLRARYPRWEQVAAAPLRSLVSLLRPGGMANQKSRRIREILATVQARFGRLDLSPIRRWESGRIIAELTTMNGVGVKTAACVCLFSLGRDVFPVDTHVHRLCVRLGLASGSKTPGETSERMKEIVPSGKGYSFHTNLIRFGRKVCRSSNPTCDRCPLYAECVYEGKGKGHRTARGRSTADHDFMLLDNVT